MRQVLIDLVNDLKGNNLVSEESINGEGRLASFVDEKNIRDWLERHPKWSNFIIKQKVRRAGDLLIKDYDENHPPHLINIKTTKLTTDNATSIVGFAYGLTNYSSDELPSRMTQKKLIELIGKNPSTLKTKDYYYLVFDKNDMSNISIRPLKDVEYWKCNPTNSLQIDWKKEFYNTNTTQDFTVSKDRILRGLKNCWQKKKKSMPEDNEWGI